MYHHSGKRNRCDYCDTAMWRKGSVCHRCEEAERVARMSWPDWEPTPELVEKIRVHLKENVSRTSDGWSEQKKMRYRRLREKKELCRSRYQGREVEYTRQNFSSSTRRGKVEDVRIRDGNIEYVLDTRPQGLKRDELESWEVVE